MNFRDTWYFWGYNVCTYILCIYLSLYSVYLCHISKYVASVLNLNFQSNEVLRTFPYYHLWTTDVLDGSSHTNVHNLHSIHKMCYLWKSKSSLEMNYLRMVHLILELYSCTKRRNSISFYSLGLRMERAALCTLYSCTYTDGLSKTSHDHSTMKFDWQERNFTASHHIQCKHLSD